MIRRLLQNDRELKAATAKLEETCEIRTDLVAPIRKKIEERRRASLPPHEEPAPNGAH